MSRSASGRGWLATFLTGILLLGAMGFFLQTGRFFNDAAAAQPFLVLDRASVSGFLWRTRGWVFTNFSTSLPAAPRVNLKAEQGELFPDFGNLLLGCPQSANVRLQAYEMDFSSAPEFAIFLRTFLNPVSKQKTGWRKSLCQRTWLKTAQGQVRIQDQTLSLQRLEIEAGLPFRLLAEGTTAGSTPFGVRLSSKPETDVVDLSVNLNSVIQIDGQIHHFLEPEAEVRGEILVKALKTASGTFSLSADARAGLDDWISYSPWPQSLELKGALQGRRGEFRHANLAAQVLQQVAQIPGLSGLKTQLAAARKSRPWFHKTATPYTVLRANVRAEHRSFHFSDVVLQHPDYSAEGEGHWDLNTGAIGFTGRLVVQEAWGHELTLRVPALAKLAGPQGRLVFAFQLDGSPQSPRIRVRLEDLADQLIASYRSELVRRARTRQESYPVKRRPA